MPLLLSLRLTEASYEMFSAQEHACVTFVPNKGFVYSIGRTSTPYIAPVSTLGSQASGASNYSPVAGVLDLKPDLMRSESDEGSAGSGMLSTGN